MPSVKLRIQKLEALEEKRNSLNELSDEELQDRILDIIRELADYSEDEISVICSEILEEHASGSETCDLEVRLNALLFASEHNEMMMEQSV